MVSNINRRTQIFFVTEGRLDSDRPAQGWSSYCRQSKEDRRHRARSQLLPQIQWAITNRVTRRVQWTRRQQIVDARSASLHGLAVPSQILSRLSTLFFEYNLMVLRV